MYYLAVLHSGSHELNICDVNDKVFIVNADHVLNDVRDYKKMIWALSTLGHDDAKIIITTTSLIVARVVHSVLGNKLERKVVFHSNKRSVLSFCNAFKFSHYECGDGRSCNVVDHMIAHFKPWN